MTEDHNTPINVVKTPPQAMAIIGIACRFALANNQHEYWFSLKHGQSHIHALSDQRKRLGKRYLHAVGLPLHEHTYYEGGFLPEIATFDHDFFGISHLEARLMSPDQRMLLETTWSAIEDAGYGNDKLRGSKTGIFLGHSTDFGIRYKDMIETLAPTLASMAITGNIHSIIASRIAYLLDLKGPSLVIDTACSSALVAVHMACRALRNGECDQAIVGSIKIDPLPLNHIKQREDEIGITSPDGRTRAFDNAANGTGLGEGVGVVVLKPLTHALADRDQIYSLIKGSAINQDGNSIGLTAPNPAAQAEVLNLAWNDAGISPQSISYIETHGTGTKLGDPIEVRGIEWAFHRATTRNQFCGIGSVKTNIGHLDHAAGMAGLIKAVLALRYKEIPPSLHIHQPNTIIDFVNSPVYVNDRLRSWKTSEIPLRCGVSAFGLSGTNCHVVLEEAPLVEPIKTPGSPNGPYVLALSAKTKNGVLGLARGYLIWLTQHPHIDLQNMCYTANTGRGHYEARLGIIFTSMDDLLTKLEQVLLESLATSSWPGIFYGTHRIVSEMQSARIASELTSTEQAHLTREAEVWLAQLEHADPTDTVLSHLCRSYVSGATITWETIYQNQLCYHISLPTYPFHPTSCWIEAAEAVSQAPQTIHNPIDHPLLDSCLAESFDRLTYQSQFDQRHWFIHEHTVNGIAVVPGTTYIEIVLTVIKRHYPTQIVQLQDVIFLSPLSIEADETRKVQTILRHEPHSLEFVVVSQAPDEAIWEKHVQGRIELYANQQPVTFDLEHIKAICSNGTLPFFPYDGDNEIVTGPHWDCLRETGIGQSVMLGFLELDQAFSDELAQYYLHPSLLDEAINIALRHIGHGLYLPFSYKCITIFQALPRRLYSYVIFKNDGIDREFALFDVHLLDEAGHELVHITQYAIKKIDRNILSQDLMASRQRYYQLVWNQKASQEASNNIQTEAIVVLHNPGNLSTQIVTALQQRYPQIKVIAIDDPQGDQQLLSHLGKHTAYHIIDLCGVVEYTINSFDALKQSLERGLWRLYHLVQRLTTHTTPYTIHLTIVAQYAYKVDGTEQWLHPHNAALFGLADVVRHEYPRLYCRCLDIDDYTDVVTIMSEVVSNMEEPLVAYRQGQRYIVQLDDFDLGSRDDSNSTVKPGGTYIITGGTGGIGLTVAEFLAAQRVARIILINRTPFPEAETWPDILAYSSDKQLCAQVRMLHNIAKSGITVQCYAANVADETQLSSVLDTVRNQGAIHGIFHAAGVAGNGFIMRRNKHDFEQVIAPKIQGTWLLDQLTIQSPLDFLVLFSSVSSLVAEVGQGDYTAANRYLDTFAYWRNQQGRRTITINWPAWQNVGMAVDHGVDMQQQFFGTIRPTDAIVALETILRKDTPQVLIGKPHLDCRLVHDTIYSFALSEPVYQRMHSIQQGYHTSNRTTPSMTRTKPVVLQGKVPPEEYTPSEQIIGNIYGSILDLETINIYDSFFDLGGNSILATKAEIHLDEHKIPIFVTELYLHKSIFELAAFLDRKSDLEPNQDNNNTLNQKNPHLTQKITGNNLPTQNNTIYNIEPFNTVFYKTCFHNSLFPIINHFYQSIMAFAANDIFFYENNNESLYDLSINNFYDKTISTILDDIGIHINAITHTSSEFPDFNPSYEDIGLLNMFSDHIGFCKSHIHNDIANSISDIIKALNQRRPVIIWVDCFYESIRKDTFQKEHWMHTILLYGYNSNKKVFHAIEHNHKDNLTYKKIEIGYNDIFNAYNGFIRNYQSHTLMPTFYEFYNKQNSQRTLHFLHIFAKNVYSHQDILYQGLSALDSFAHTLKLICMDEEALKWQSDRIINTVTAILLSKQVEYHNIQLLFPDRQVAQLLQRVVDVWAHIRQVLIKYTYVQVYNRDKMMGVVKSIETLVLFEHDYYGELCNCVREWRTD